MKIIIKIMLGLILVGAVGIVVINQNAIAAARAEHQALMGESEEARRLEEQNKDIDRLRAEHGEWEKLREENKELLKLRNEVRQLRRQVQEMANLRAENLRLSAAPINGARPPSQGQLPPGYITRAALADVGLGSPEAAVQTVLWSMVHGDIKRLLQCTTPEMAQKMSTDGEEKLRRESTNMANSFPGYRISEKKEISPNEVVLKMEVVEGTGGNSLRLKRIGNEWRLSED